MKPLTEQRRQELIADLEEVIKVETHSLYGIAARIALASLTAKPEYFQWKWARDKNASWTTNPIEQLENAVAAFGGDGENVNYRMQYTAPPVPVIKFPNPQDIPDGYDLPSCMATAEWYQQEIKRLNGLGE